MASMQCLTAHLPEHIFYYGGVRNEESLNTLTHDRLRKGAYFYRPTIAITVLLSLLAKA